MAKVGLTCTVMLGTAAWLIAGPAHSIPGSGRLSVINPATMVSSPSAAAEPASKTTQKGTKEKQLKGDLVDATCMAKVLGVNTGTSTEPTESSPAPAVPHFASGPMDPPQARQGPGGQAPGPGGVQQMPSGPPSAAPIQESPEEQAREARANRVDEAAKTCTARPSTSAFDLAMSGGEVLQFDPSGNVIAKQALKEVTLPPGKKVKAKVTALMENNKTAKVEAVDIKEKGK